MDLDTGRDAIEAAKAAALGQGWIRLRGIAMPEGGERMAVDSEEHPAKSEARILETRRALQELRDRGLKTCVLLRWPARRWKTAYLPNDLREAYESGRKRGLVYGDLVDAWEVDNEPDLGFVPESAERFSAYLKAVYLGIKAGCRERMADGQQQMAADSGEQRAVSGRQSSDVGLQQAPLVLMGSLGLPPGPWLERFAANDGFSYTDGFNYHYYGYAEDFSGVYQQHEAALRELGARSLEQETDSSKLIAKSYPIFLTEVGYGMLGKGAMSTKEGRLRQWRWFKSVGEQAKVLKIEAPMAFHLPPYLEYDTSEYGLTVPARPATVKAEGRWSAPHGDGEVKVKAEEWTAGGISYCPEDFGVKSAEPWMEMIGKQIGGNDVTPALAQWLEARKSSGRRFQVSGFTTGTRSWTVSVPSPSPVVIDIINGEGLSFVKRYNGSFVVGKSPVAPEKTEVGKLKTEKPKLQTAGAKTESSSTPLRNEELMIQLRTQTGNLYEVYPTRMASPEWQTYQEPHGNFTMSFYGRAELPWRFKDNKPASLVVVMYPKQLPVTYEFRRVHLYQLGASSLEQGKNIRYGAGRVVLYNFSDRPVAGRLRLPEAVELAVPNAPSIDELIVLQPGERREIAVSIQVPWGKYARIESSITFVPEDKSISPARLVTAFLPDISGLHKTMEAALLPLTRAGSEEAGANTSFLLSRPRATEEAPSSSSTSFNLQVPGIQPFAQQGSKVERTTDGFTVTVTGTPPGKQQRVEVEIPWLEGVAFEDQSFLSIEYRLHPSRSN